MHDSTESYYSESRNHLETENITIITPAVGQSARDRRQLEATAGSEGCVRGGEAASPPPEANPLSVEGNWQQRLGVTLPLRAEGSPAHLSNKRLVEHQVFYQRNSYLTLTYS